MDKRQAICDMGYEEAVVFDAPDYDDAIVGVSDDGNVIYDFDAMVKILQERDGMTDEEAVDFISYNTMRSIPYAGEHPPIIIYRIPEE